MLKKLFFGMALLAMTAGCSNGFLNEGETSSAGSAEEVVSPEKTVEPKKLTIVPLQQQAVVKSLILYFD